LRKLKIPQQIVSLSIIFALLIAALIISRTLLIPKSFGQYGHYRAEAVEEVASRPIQYAGYRACLDCHDDIYQLKSRSNHQGLSCEICHGAAAKHAEAPDEEIPTAPRERDLCPLCHGYNPSRPTGFPQIIAASHNPGKPCITCHNPHDPVTPRKPQDCSACHREIWNEKAISPHVSLPCTRCHAIKEAHLISPRSALPQKPASREFCGECHSQDADSPGDVPRIDMAAHGGNYKCWDCHYPHHPEAR
jgi:hypothetical protein